MTSTEQFAGFSNLLIPIDLTSNSDRVLGRLALLPLAHGARLTLLHVVPNDVEAEARIRAETDAKKTLADEALHLAKSLPASVCIEQVLLRGAAATEIARCSAETGAEMIVMGRGGAHALREAFLGSTAERVMRKTKLPVLVVRNAPHVEYERPALALDEDGAAGVALAQMMRIIRGRKLNVTVIHAFDIPYQRLISPALVDDDGSDDAYAGQFRPQAAQKIGAVLTAALAAANIAPVDAPVFTNQVRPGAPRFVIAKAVEQADSDLLVMGTRGNSGLAYAFLGTVAGDVLRSVNCDVLVVPPPGEVAESS